MELEVLEKSFQKFLESLPHRNIPDSPPNDGPFFNEEEALERVEGSPLSLNSNYWYKGSYSYKCPY